MNHESKAAEGSLVEAQVDDIHGLYRGGRLTPLELVNFYLNRIDLLDLNTDAGPPFNCIVCVSPSVREEAAALGDEILRHGVIKPLHGIPVWVKDNIQVEGLPTTGGCLALEEGVALRDAPLVGRLRAAGAIIMGKVGMTELGIGSSEYSTMSGRIGNALDPRNPPGGSSNGSAVAVSLNLGMLAVGVDDCASITYPAALNSCVGLRPTAGLVSRAGLLSYSETETTPGPICRTVIDAARMFDVLAGPATEPGFEMTTDASLRGKRVGIIAATDSVDFMTDVPPAVREAFASRLAQLEDAGVTVVRDLRLEGFRWTRKAILEHYNSQIESLRGRQAFPRSPHQLYTADRISPVIRKVRGHPLFRFELSVRLPNVFAWSYRRVIEHNQRCFRRLLAAANVEVLISVTTPAPSRIATLARIPHLTVPAGHIEAEREMTAGGFVEGSRVPWGISILGAPGTDGRVLAVGYGFEQVFKGRLEPACGIAEGSMADGFDIQAFNRLKRAIAYQSYRSLQLSEDRRTYIHPTADEFRALVRQITAAGGL
jgi:Asp-tRNA(Asn)/Glu-tRNA(Gln) amidotransferase A subunit family amidase